MEASTLLDLKEESWLPIEHCDYSDWSLTGYTYFLTERKQDRLFTLNLLAIDNYDHENLSSTV